MDCPFFVNLVCSDLNSIFNILNVIMTYHRVLTNNNILKIKSCDFLTIWPFEPHFLVNFFILKNVYEEGKREK